MFYLVKGNAQKIIQVFRHDGPITKKAQNTKNIELGFQCTPFMGTEEHILTHYNLWYQKSLGNECLDDNMSACNLGYLLGPSPLKSAEEDEKIYRQNFIFQHFSYIDDADEYCGMEMYRKDDPHQWMMGWAKKSSVGAYEQQLVFLSSFDLTPFMHTLDPAVKMYSIATVNNEFIKKIDAGTPSTIIQRALNVDGKLVLNPQEYLRESIRYHYHKELKNVPDFTSHLRKLNLQELKSTSEVLLLLKKFGITDSNRYYLALRSDKKGQALRLLLPQLRSLKAVHRNSLIDILYAGVERSIQSQGNEVLAINDSPELFKCAQSLHELFICVTQMQDLELNKEMIELASKEHCELAKRFRQIILRVEAQCKKVYERLSGSISYRSMLFKWNAEEKRYRKSLYRIAYSGLMKLHIDKEKVVSKVLNDFQAKLRITENKILKIVDPDVRSEAYKALIAIANLIIAVLTLTVANWIKYKKSGNCWFFTQTRSGEEWRALNKDILTWVEAEKSMSVAQGAFS